MGPEESGVSGGVRKVAWAPNVPFSANVTRASEFPVPEKEVSDTSPALESNVPDRARGLSVAETAPTLVETWARSAAFTYFVLLTVAALAIGLG